VLESRRARTLLVATARRHRNRTGATCARRLPTLHPDRVALTLQIDDRVEVRASLALMPTNIDVNRRDASDPIRAPHVGRCPFFTDERSVDDAPATARPMAGCGYSI